MKKFFLICACLFLAVPCQAEIIYVDDDGPADFNNIQDAIDYSSDGDIVEVQPGTYYENINFNGKNIILTGSEPNDPCVVVNTTIDGNDNGSVITFAGTEDVNCFLTGFTITSGATDYDGGGINGNGTKANVINCRIIGNIAGKDYGFGSGGGIYNLDGKITNCNISYNSIEWQGFGGGGLANCDGPIANCRITHNSSYWCYGRGGGGLRGCNGPITSCVIAFNSDNGGEYGGNGGGLSGCDGEISNCLIYANRAYTSYWSLPDSSNYGGGLYDCDGDIVNCNITFNVADNNGLGGFGGAMARCDAKITNCIIWGNLAPNEPQLYSSSEPNYSCIQYWAGGGVGNIVEDPCFVDPNNGDYHLKSQAGRWDPNTLSWAQDDITSLCIDTGDPNSSIGWEPYPNGGRINMGAYGGTEEASKSYFGRPVCKKPIAGDVNGDCRVDFEDLAIMGLHWLQDNNE
ncbi:MAG: right-handed parallel beta-helix repeat-containing protein [Planctomycetota bacterium]|jgi:hypothetical protein